MFGAGLVGAISGHETASAYVGQDDDGGEVGHYQEGGRMSAELPVGAAAGPYGGDYAPPEELTADALDHLTFPPPPTPSSRSRTIDVEMGVVEAEHAISRTQTITAWSYTVGDGASSPGPILRANEGDLLRIRFSNRTAEDHNLHFHGRHSPIHDGWEPVPPGGETVYEIEAGPAGIHPYHCHTVPIDRHIAKGLYGTLIVDGAPSGSGDRSPDRAPDEALEVVLALSGWDPDQDGHNDFYTWNGVAGFFDKYPIKVEVGRKVRVHLFNMVEFDPLVSFHLHAEMFDVYPTGMGRHPALTSDIISLGPMDRATLEFTLPERGRYLFHPHQHWMAARGAMGWFAAI